MGNKRKVCVVITARPSYSRVKTVLREIQRSKNLELQIIAAASALLDRYGSIIKLIEEDNFKISAKVFNVLEGENLTAAAKTTGIGIMELSSVFDNIKPDIVVTIADRFETMATAVSASYMNIPLAHIQGGEVTGNIDEKVRHSITKLSDYHFVASENARHRVIRLGENPNLVFNTGCPSIDLARSIANNQLDFDPYIKYGGVGSKPSLSSGYIVVMQHPVTTEHSKSRSHIEQTLQAIVKIGIPALWFWPNVDAGADGTSAGIRSFRENNDVNNIHYFKNMEGTDFLKLLNNSKLIVGNSSVGIRECSYLGVPAVNIGTRQRNRDRGENVIDTDYNSDEIEQAIRRQLKTGKAKRSNTYGDGHSGKRIAKLLETVPLTYYKTLEY